MEREDGRKKDIKQKGYYFTLIQGHFKPKFNIIFPPSEEIYLTGYSLWLYKQTKEMDASAVFPVPLVFSRMIP